MRQLVGFIAYLITGGHGDRPARARPGGDAVRLLQPRLRGRHRPALRRGPRVFDPAVIRTRTTTRSSGAVTPTPATGSKAARPGRSAQRGGARALLSGRSSAASSSSTPRRPTCSRSFRPTRASSRHSSIGRGRRPAASSATWCSRSTASSSRTAPTGRRRRPLWQSHRYDVRAPTAFVSLHALATSISASSRSSSPMGRGVAARRAARRRSSPWSPLGRAAMSPARIDRELYPDPARGRARSRPLELVTHRARGSPASSTGSTAPSTAVADRD